MSYPCIIVLVSRAVENCLQSQQGVRAVLQARGAIANFMGHIEVQPEEANYRLTPGLWLVSSSKGPGSVACLLPPV